MGEPGHHAGRLYHIADPAGRHLQPHLPAQPPQVQSRAAAASVAEPIADVLHWMCCMCCTHDMVSYSKRPLDVCGVCTARGGAVPPGAEEEIPRCEQIPMTWWLGGLAASTALCTAVLSPMFDLPVRPSSAQRTDHWVLSRTAEKHTWGSCRSLQPTDDANVAGVAAAGGRRNRAAGGAAGGACAGGDGPQPRLGRRQAVTGAPHRPGKLYMCIPSVMHSAAGEWYIAISHHVVSAGHLCSAGARKDRAQLGGWCHCGGRCSAGGRHDAGLQVRSGPSDGLPVLASTLHHAAAVPGVAR